MNSIKRILSLILVLMLSAVAILNLNSCDKKIKETDDGVKRTIKVTVVDDKAESTEFTIVTTKTTLRGALEQENLIEGEESQYGLYVKYVNGVRADYDQDKAYWRFTKNGVDLMSGVDSELISDGDCYEITYTKG